MSTLCALSIFVLPYLDLGFSRELYMFCVMGLVAFKSVHAHCEFKSRDKYTWSTLYYMMYAIPYFATLTTLLYPDGDSDVKVVTGLFLTDLFFWSVMRLHDYLAYKARPGLVREIRVSRTMKVGTFHVYRDSLSNELSLARDEMSPMPEDVLTKMSSVLREMACPSSPVYEVPSAPPSLLCFFDHERRLIGHGAAIKHLQGSTYVYYVLTAGHVYNAAKFISKASVFELLDISKLHNAKNNTGEFVSSHHIDLAYWRFSSDVGALLGGVSATTVSRGSFTHSVRVYARVSKGNSYAVQTSQGNMFIGGEGTYMAHNCSTTHGWSGTPLYNNKNEVVAIHVGAQIGASVNVCEPVGIFLTHKVPTSPSRVETPHLRGSTSQAVEDFEDDDDIYGNPFYEDDDFSYSPQYVKVGKRARRTLKRKAMQDDWSTPDRVVEETIPNGKKLAGVTIDPNGDMSNAKYAQFLKHLEELANKINQTKPSSGREAVTTVDPRSPEKAPVLKEEDPKPKVVLNESAAAASVKIIPQPKPKPKVEPTSPGKGKNKGNNNNNTTRRNNRRNVNNQMMRFFTPTGSPPESVDSDNTGDAQYYADVEAQEAYDRSQDDLYSVTSFNSAFFYSRDYDADNNTQSVLMSATNTVLRWSRSCGDLLGGMWKRVGDIEMTHRASEEPFRPLNTSKFDPLVQTIAKDSGFVHPAGGAAAEKNAAERKSERFVKFLESYNVKPKISDVIDFLNLAKYPSVPLPNFITFGDNVHSAAFEEAFGNSFIIAVANLTATSSPGMPWSALGNNGRVTVDHLMEVYQATLELYRVLCMENFQNYPAAQIFAQTGVIWKLFIKKEMHPARKAKDGSWRLIFSSPIHLTILSRMINGAQNDAEIREHKNICSKPGISLTGADGPQAMWDYVHAWDTAQFACTDVPEWDWHYTSELSEFNADARLIQWKINQYKPEVSRNACRLMYNLHYLSMRKTICFSDGSVYCQIVDGIQPSGRYETSSDNSRARAFYRFLAVGDAKVAANGDDSIEASQEGLEQAYQALGLGFKSVEFHKCNDRFEFCSKWFWKDPDTGFVYCKPTESSKIKMLVKLEDMRVNSATTYRDAQQSISQEMLYDEHYMSLANRNVLSYVFYDHVDNAWTFL